MADRIRYPETWSLIERNRLDAMFVEARAKGLWFSHKSMAVVPVWFSPDELQELQLAGKFMWSSENWQLRDPQEELNHIKARLAGVQSELDAFVARIAKSKDGNV